MQVTAPAPAKAPVLHAANASAGATPKADAKATVLAAYTPSSTAALVEAQATDALAAEALDATDGAFPSVADVIEA